MPEDKKELPSKEESKSRWDIRTSVEFEKEPFYKINQLVHWKGGTISSVVDQALKEFFAHKEDLMRSLPPLPEDWYRTKPRKKKK